jgi:hypothetical protein
MRVSYCQNQMHALRYSCLHKGDFHGAMRLGLLMGSARMTNLNGVCLAPRGQTEAKCPQAESSMHISIDDGGELRVAMQ